MYVYDEREHKLLEYTSAKIEEIKSETSCNSFVITFSSPDGESIQRKCRGYFEATEYMNEVATAADAGATLILVDNA